MHAAIKSCVRKSAFKVQDGPMDFNVIVQKLIDVVSNSTLQLLKNLDHLSSFVVVPKKNYPQLSEKTIKILFAFQLYKCVRLNFLHIFQPEQHTAAD